MDVNQATRSAIVNWNSFNIGSQAQVNFNQPDASSVVLNRVLGGNGSTILGQIDREWKSIPGGPGGDYLCPRSAGGCGRSGRVVTWNFRREFPFGKVSVRESRRGRYGDKSGSHFGGQMADTLR
jgi:hypothetical protein